MKKILLFGTTALMAASAQAQIYKTDTAFTTEAGAGGAKASCISKPNGTNYGINMNRANSFWVAEDFVVPSGQTWNLDTVIVYGYQTGSGNTSTITSGNLQIFQTTPGGPVAYGDTTTNRLVASSWSGIYRVDTAVAAGGATGTQRPIMTIKMKVSPTKSLSAGTYWAAWSTAGSSSFTGPWCPPKVLPGRVNPTGQNGMQKAGGTWVAAKDSASPTTVQTLGFGMILKGPQSTGILNTGNNPGTELHITPNPAKDAATIAFKLLEAGPVTVSLYDGAGRLLRTLISEHRAAGDNTVPLDTRDLASGNYFYQVQTNNGGEMKLMQVSH